MNPNKVFQTTIVDDIFIVELVGVVSSLADDRITRELDAVRERIKVGKHLSVIVDLVMSHILVPACWKRFECCGTILRQKMGVSCYAMHRKSAAKSFRSPSSITCGRCLEIETTQFDRYKR